MGSGWFCQPRSFPRQVVATRALCPLMNLALGFLLLIRCPQPQAQKGLGSTLIILPETVPTTVMPTAE